MSQHSLNKKLWQIHKSKKILAQITRKNCRKNKAKQKRKHRYIKQLKKSEYTVCVPKKFSIIYNYEETISVFNEVISALKSDRRNVTVHFDLSKVEFITNDAIMYILALISNIKSKRGFNYEFDGNVPKNAKANEIFKQSGFYKYVYSNRKNLIKSQDKIMICTDKNSNGLIASEICQFVIDKLNKDKRYTKGLYETLIELMSNTYHHAYDDIGIFEKVWYIYAEFHDDKVKCLFLDTGVGIASTVNKKFKEKLSDYFSGKENDSDYVFSAFTGETLRSRTKLPYRGGGLPHIYERCQKGILKEFTVFSGHAKCTYSNKHMRCDNMKSKFTGTLYYWEIN